MFDNNMESSNVGKLEENALKRKERLKEHFMKRTNSEGEANCDQNRDTDESTSLPAPVFRNYEPVNESLKQSQLERTKPVDVTDKVSEQLEAGKPAPVIEEVDLINLAPRKPDWDLKRDVAKKIEKLERRTQRAIAEIIRERLQAEKGSEDLASIVNAGVQAEQKEYDSD